MASIFDSLADTTEAPPKPNGTGSIFDDLGEPETKPAAAPVEEIPRGSPYTAPAAVPQAPPLTAGRVAGKVGEAAVDLVDMAISGVPAMLLGTIGEVTQRLGSLVDGRGYREGAKAGAEFSRSMGERFGRPLYDNLKAAGVIKGTETSLPQQAMEKIGGWLEHAATVVEHDSKGVISKEDYLASVNGFMAAMGVKGLKAMTQGALNKVEARGTKSAWDSALERFDAEEQLARQVETERDAAKLTTPVADAAKIRLMARQPSEATRTKEQARKDARAAFGTPEAEAQAGLVDRQAAYREELAAQEAAVRDRFPPSGERTGSRGPVDLALEGKETPTTYGGNQPFHTADTTAALKRGVVADTPIQTEGRLAPVAATPLDSGLVKVKEGRLFDMTMEERLAVRNSVDITDPKVITAVAVGATGLGLAMAYEPSAEEAAMAIGAGALLRRGGEGLPMRELLAKPEATPLGALLESSAYTTRTLERLAEASPGKFEYKKTQIEQLLKQSDVTAHERGIMQEALASVPGDTITAKGLLTGVRVATKDFELTPVKSDSFASYGLDNIDRGHLAPDDYTRNDVADMQQRLTEHRTDLPLLEERAAAGEATFPDYPHNARQARSAVSTTRAEIAELEQAIAGQEMGPPSEAPTTRIYRSPLELGSNNHFGDPNYFAHTRSFVEDGTRHVVELQSDLAQKAGKVLKPEERAKLTERQARLEDTQTKLSGALQRWDDGKASLAEMREKLLPLREVIEDATSFDGPLPEAIETVIRRARTALNNTDMNLAETKAKLTQEGPISTLAPMLKDWHKRLVREELADAARNLEGSVRFATADTVAKVEGWTDKRPSLEREIASKEKSLRGAEIELADRRGRQERALDELGWRIKRQNESPSETTDRLVDSARERLKRNADALKDFEADLESTKTRLEEARTQLLKSPKGPILSPEHQGIYDRYSRDVEKFLRQLGAQPITDSAGHTWLEVPLGEQQKALPGGGARTQLGGVDPALAKAVGAVGGSAALAWMLSRDKDKAKHAAMTGVLTGLGLLLHSRVPAIRMEVNKAIQGAQNLVGNISTDKSISPPLLRRLTSHAEEEMRGIHDSGKRIAPFLEMADQLPEAAKRNLDAALLNGRTSDIIAAVGKAATPGLLKAWNEVQVELKSLGNQLIAVRGLKELRPDYFPRIVKDLPGLLNAIGKEFSTPLQQALKVAEARAGGFLDEAGRSQVINTFIEKNLRASTAGGKPSFFKRRTLGDVTVDLAPYYVEPTQALPLYIGSAVRAIEKAKFFGKDLVRDPETGRPNLEGSIGNIVAKENLTPEKFDQLTALLRSRFGPAYQSPARGLQSLSQLTNIALLGNVFSGLMNVADIGAIAAQHGVLPLVAAVTKMVRGTAKLKAADVGMADAIGAEFVYGTRDPVKLRLPLTERTVQISLAKALDKTFKLSGFKVLDTVMKEVNLNAAMEKYSRLSRTKPGEARILRQYGDYFTTDMPQLLADLRAGAKTKLTTELAFRELSDAQPTTKIEMPKFYLDHPNLRFGYALKSFMIKQMNFVKKRGIDEIAKGNVVEGGGFIVRYALMAGAAGATMDWIVKSLLGRDADLDWKSIPLNALKNMGLSEYVIDKARQGKGKEAILAATVPPADPILNMVTADPQSVRYIPLVGRFAYDRFMDGAEKANAAKKLAEKKKAADARRTPEERRELERRALERRKALTQ